MALSEIESPPSLACAAVAFALFLLCVFELGLKVMQPFVRDNTRFLFCAAILLLLLVGTPLLKSSLGMTTEDMLYYRWKVERLWLSLPPMATSREEGIFPLRLFASAVAKCRATRLYDLKSLFVYVHMSNVISNVWFPFHSTCVHFFNQIVWFLLLLIFATFVSGSIFGIYFKSVREVFASVFAVLSSPFSAIGSSTISGSSSSSSSPTAASEGSAAKKSSWGLVWLKIKLPKLTKKD